jgi:hypothetical protein
MPTQHQQHSSSSKEAKRTDILYQQQQQVLRMFKIVFLLFLVPCSAELNTAVPTSSTQHSSTNQHMQQGVFDMSLSYKAYGQPCTPVVM